jgi:hypothetical protein
MKTNNKPVKKKSFPLWVIITLIGCAPFALVIALDRLGNPSKQQLAASRPSVPPNPSIAVKPKLKHYESSTPSDFDTQLREASAQLAKYEHWEIHTAEDYSPHFRALGKCIDEPSQIASMVMVIWHSFPKGTTYLDLIKKGVQVHRSTGETDCTQMFKSIGDSEGIESWDNRYKSTNAYAVYQTRCGYDNTSVNFPIEKRPCD